MTSAYARPFRWSHVKLTFHFTCLLRRNFPISFRVIFGEIISRLMFGVEDFARERDVSLTW